MVEVPSGLRTQCGILGSDFSMAFIARNNRIHHQLYLPCLRTLATVSRQKKKQASLGKDAQIICGGVISDAAQDISSTWRSIDSKYFGIEKSMISSPALTVLRVLRTKGFESYLVGGCVRDLILRKIPKDFDIVTTATLKQVKREFQYSWIVGRRFPLCHVRIRGSVIEVTSFETKYNSSEDGNLLLSEMPAKCSKADLLRWRDCMRRDFTINSLFYEPFKSKIYDYAGGVKDLKTQKVRTITRPHISFKEDCARILRGLRVAARLGLTFAADTESAIRNHAASLVTLEKTRLMMEMNYMLSYGAAESSLYLLQRFNVLEMLLPAQAAYLAHKSRKLYSGKSNMLMALFFNMDKLFDADRPANSHLWVSLLAFHHALIDQPQDALVVWAFCLLLQHKEWAAAIQTARENARPCDYAEISKNSKFMSDETLHAAVSRLASLVKCSVEILVDAQALQKSLARHRLHHSSSTIFISKGLGRAACHLFDILDTDVPSSAGMRKSTEIDYMLLSRGDMNEVRFVIGKIIMDTMKMEEVEEQNMEVTLDLEIPSKPIIETQKIKPVMNTIRMEEMKGQELKGTLEEDGSSEERKDVRIKQVPRLSFLFS